MNDHTETITRLLAHTGKILEMAQDLSDRGFRAESVVFALIGAQHCQAIRALEWLDEQFNKKS